MVFELLRRQALPLPVDICYFRKPVRAGGFLPPPPPHRTPSFRHATARDLWPPSFESSRHVKASELEDVRNSSGCIGLVSDKSRRRVGMASKNQGHGRRLHSVHLLVT